MSASQKYINYTGRTGRHTSSLC